MVDTHHCHVLPRAVIWPGWAPLLPSSTHTPLWLWLSWPINCDTLQLVFWGSQAGTMTVRNASGLAWECLHSAAFFLCIKWTLDQCWEMLHEGKIQWSTYIPFDGNFALKRLCFFAVLSLEKKTNVRVRYEGYGHGVHSVAPKLLILRVLGFHCSTTPALQSVLSAVTWLRQNVWHAGEKLAESWLQIRMKQQKITWAE